MLFDGVLADESIVKNMFSDKTAIRTDKIFLRIILSS